eukprot:3018316-Pleurochrysis_carterae.AAC.1
MPCIGRFIKRMTGLQAKPSLHPEEAVALGAAVQAPPSQPRHASTKWGGRSSTSGVGASSRCNGCFQH